MAPINFKVVKFQQTPAPVPLEIWLQEKEGNILVRAKVPFEGFDTFTIAIIEEEGKLFLPSDVELPGMQVDRSGRVRLIP